MAKAIVKELYLKHPLNQIVIGLDVDSEEDSVEINLGLNCGISTFSHLLFSAVCRITSSVNIFNIIESFF